jgi:hypothetical protein
LTVLIIQRTPATEAIVVLCDREYPRLGHIPPAQNVLQKRDDIFGLFGSAKRNQEKSIVAIRHLTAVWLMPSVKSATVILFTLRAIDISL